MTSARRNTFDIFDELLQKSKKETSNFNGELRLHASLDAQDVSKNIEAIYQITTRRICLIGYQLEWAAALQERPSTRPDWHLANKSEKFTARFSLSPPDNLSNESILIANRNFINSLRKQALKDFAELFDLYLDCIYEKLVLLQKHKEGFNEEDIKKALQFTRKSTEKKLTDIRGFAINTKMSDAVESLAKARNLYVHTDNALSPPTRKHLENECIWYSTTIRFREKKSGAMIELENMPNIFSGDQYPEVELTFLDPTRKNSAVINEQGQLILDDKDLREIGFFYMMCIDEYHRELISYARTHGVNARDVEEYPHKSRLKISVSGEPQESNS